MGRIGHSILRTFGSPRMLEAIGFMFVSFVLPSLGRIYWQLFIVALTLFFKKILVSLLRTVKLLLSIKS